MGFSGNGAHPRKGAVGFKLVEVPAGRVSPHSSEVVAVLVAAEGPGWASHSNQASLVWRAPCGLVGQAAVPVGGGGAWPGFKPTRRAAEQRPGPTGVEGAGGSGGPGCGAGGWRQGQGGPRDRPLRAFRLACGDLAGGPPPTGTHSGRAPQSSPARQGSQTKTSGTGRRHDPRLGRQGTQSCNPESIRNVGGATRPGHSQGRPDKRNDVLGGPAQAS